MMRLAQKRDCATARLAFAISCNLFSSLSNAVAKRAMVSTSPMSAR